MKETMKCPSDKTTLIRQAGWGMETHSCNECAGLWVSLADFQNRLPRQTFAERPRRNFAGGRDCPKCALRMEVWDWHGVEVDACRSCRGVWFDRGELEKIAEVRKEKPAIVSDDKGNLHWLDALDLIEPICGGIKGLGKAVEDVIDVAPDVAEGVAAGIVEIIAGIFSAF